MYSSVDIKIDDDGDLEVDASGDIELSTPAESITQEILFRLKTNHGEYMPRPSTGSNLNRMTGRTVSQRTEQEMYTSVFMALTRDLFLMPNDFILEIVPIATDEMAAIVLYTGLVEDTNVPIIVTHTVSLTENPLAEESILNTEVV